MSITSRHRMLPLCSVLVRKQFKSTLEKMTLSKETLYVNSANASFWEKMFYSKHQSHRYTDRVNIYYNLAVS